MKAVYDVIMKCRATSSKLEKEALLRTLKENDTAREFFRVAYEPRINFYMKKIDTKLGVKSDDGFVIFEINAINAIVNAIAKREITGNAAKTWIGSLYKSFEHDWERELLSMFIERDVKAGFSISTINKVWPDLITDVPYMRCCLPKDAKLDSFDWAGGVFSQIKADGMFANINHESNGKVTITSRNGSPFPVDHTAFTTLIANVQAMVPRGHQLHGELLMFDNGNMLPRQDGNGKFNTLLQGGELAGELGVFYECWDMIPIIEARAKNKYGVSYLTRFQRLEEALTASVFSSSNALGLIETKFVHSLKEAYEHYRDALERDLEGTIVKNPSMIWEDTTSKQQVKLKLEFEVDLKVVGYDEGRGKNVGTLGALKCESADGQLKVDVGSGFTDEQRKWIWQERGLNVVTVKSNSIMPPTRKEHHSLFLPIFVENRLDKKEADTLQKILDQYEATIRSI